jgi:hypothetical protein
MFHGRRSDRRRGYSFRGHFRRVLETRGVGRVSASLCGTALVAGLFFAHCRSADVTGPGSPPSSSPSQPTDPGSPKPSSEAFVSQTKLSDIDVPIVDRVNFDGSPCTHEPIEPGKNSHTYFMLMQVVTTSGQTMFHVHINQEFVGVGVITGHKYSSSKEYDADFAPSYPVRSHGTLEYNVIASGESLAGITYYPGDDFLLHSEFDVSFDASDPTAVTNIVPVASATLDGRCK